MDLLRAAFLAKVIGEVPSFGFQNFCSNNVVLQGGSAFGISICWSWGVKILVVFLSVSSSGMRADSSARVDTVSYCIQVLLT